MGLDAGDGLSERALQCAEDLADIVLRQILVILNQNDNNCFETELHPPSRFRDQICALLNFGPANLGTYHYFYGLLDCASQLGTISGPDRYPAGFGARMRSIISRSTDATFRWKAVSAHVTVEYI